jgi:hypothetical protein
MKKKEFLAPMKAKIVIGKGKKQLSIPIIISVDWAQYAKEARRRKGLVG